MICMSDLVVRPASSDDASAIAQIYNEGITDRIATFETQPRSAEDIAAGLARKGGWPPHDRCRARRTGRGLGGAPARTALARPMRVSPSTRYTSRGRRGAPGPAVPRCKHSAGPTPSAASGSSRPVSFPRTSPASPCTSSVAVPSADHAAVTAITSWPQAEPSSTLAICVVWRPHGHSL